MYIQWNPESAVVLDFMSSLTLALSCWFQPSVHKNNIKPQLILQFLNSILITTTFLKPWQWKYIQFYTYNVPFWKMQRNTWTVLFTFKVCLSKRYTFEYKCFWTSHDSAQQITYTHSHAHRYTWVAAAICFRTNLINNIYKMLGIVYKHGNL